MLEGRYETLRTVDNLAERRGEADVEGPLQERTNVILALQDEILLFGERLALRPLLRYQFVANHFGAQPSFRNLPLRLDQETQDHLFSPSLGLKYALAPFFDLKGNVGRFQRVPTLFEVVSTTKAYAMVGYFLDDGTCSNVLISFDPSTGVPLVTLADNLASAPNFAISNAGALYLGETNLTTPTPGVRIFDTALDVEITAAPVNVGALPPNWVLMVEVPQVALTVHKAGTGTGTVTAVPAGLDCGPVCTQRYPMGTTVTLTATPAPGGTFAGWQGGGCTGTAPCAILLEQGLAVVAIFQ